MGAKPKLTDEEIAELRQRLHDEELIRVLMKGYGVFKAAVYRYLGPSEGSTL